MAAVRHCRSRGAFSACAARWRHVDRPRCCRVSRRIGSGLLKAFNRMSAAFRPRQPDKDHDILRQAYVSRRGSAPSAATSAACSNKCRLCGQRRVSAAGTGLVADRLVSRNAAQRRNRARRTRTIRRSFTTASRTPSWQSSTVRSGRMCWSSPTSSERVSVCTGTAVT